MSIIAALSQWQGLVYLVGNMVLGLVMLAITAKFVTRKEHDSLKDRVVSVETRVSNMPDTKTIHDLALQLSDLKGELRSMPLRFERVDALSLQMQKQVDRIEDYLDERGVK